MDVKTMSKQNFNNVPRDSPTMSSAIWTWLCLWGPGYAFVDLAMPSASMEIPTVSSGCLIKPTLMPRKHGLCFVLFLLRVQS